MATKNISNTHPLYEDYKESWKTMRDCVDGEDTVKQEGVIYLPMKSAVAAMKDEQLKINAYIGYRSRAEFPELVSPTVRGSAGLICTQPPKIELPTQMEYLREDATGDGTTLEDFHKRIVSEQLITGRYGILPGLDPDVAGQFILTGYKAEQIINWDKNNRGKVNFLVLDESEEVRDPISNQWSPKARYLECYLDEAGNYVAQRYEDNEPAEDPVMAMRPDKTALDSVPFVFINVSDMTPEPDDVPLYGLSKIALRIYRLDADYMQGLHMTSEPTPYITGFDDAKAAIEAGNVPTTIGAANLWVLPKGATADFLEFSGPGLEAQAHAIEKSLERAVIFGVQIFSDNKSAESGESRRLRMRGQQSLVRNIAITAASGLERVLRNIAVWSGLDPDKVTVKPNLDFTEYSLDANELRELVAGWQAGAYSKKTLFENLQRADMIPTERTFEDEQDLIEQEGPILGTITDPVLPGGAGSSGNQQ